MELCVYSLVELRTEMAFSFQILYFPIILLSIIAMFYYLVYFIKQELFSNLLALYLYISLPGQDAANYISDLVNPILACMSDTDLRTRYFACESLYNVMKVSREAILVHFSDIFSALSKLVADPDQNVKNGTELLDRLMKVLYKFPA